MKLGKQVGLGFGHIVLDGDPAPHPQRGTAPPNFCAHVPCGQTAGWTKVPRATEIRLGPCDFVLDGDPAHPSPKRGQSPPNLWPMSVVAKWLDGSR